jgi:hypothetical protein
MSDAAAFLPQSATMYAVSSGTVSTATTQAIAFPGASTAVMGPAVPPPVAMLVNLGATLVWVSLTLAARTAAIPTAGVTTFEVPLIPNVPLFLRVPFAQGSSGAEGTAGTPILGGGPPQGATINLNMISTGTSIPVSVTFGEGI